MAVGVAMKALAFPGAFKNSLAGMSVTTSYLDPGAVQRQEPVSLPFSRAEIYNVA